MKRSLKPHNLGLWAMPVLFAILLVVYCNSGCRLQADPVDVQVTRTWTATGDDGIIGTATHYDARYSTSQDSLILNWFQCAAWTVPADPKLSGERESITFPMTVTTGVTYYFAIKAADETYNWSLISNIKEQTWADNMPPSQIIDLE